MFFDRLDYAIKSAWEYFVLGFALLILPDEPGDKSNSGDHDHEDEAFRLWDDIGGEG
jgi:hypothetical protein